MEKNTKVVIIDSSIIDNQIYEIVDFAFDYTGKELFYLIQYNTHKIIVNKNQIRPATQVEIDNGLKFDPIKVKTVVAFVDLLKPNFLMEIKEFDQVTLNIVAEQLYSKEIYNLKIDEVRPARLNEINSGKRITVYNKEMYLRYFNPFMIYDLYNISDYENVVYKNTFSKLCITQGKNLTINGEHLYNDVDFQYLIMNMYDLNNASQYTTHIATDRDGTVTEFKMLQGSIPMFDEVNGRWYIVETDSEYVVSKNKVNGMMKTTDYINSLKYIGE